MPLALICQILTDCTREEEYHDHGRCDPEGSVEIWIALENIKEVCTRVESAATAVQDGCRVYIEELLVELDRPEVAFRGGWSGVGGGWECASLASIGLDLVA